jgi:hypothetical protein
MENRRSMLMLPDRPRRLAAICHGGRTGYRPPPPVLQDRWRQRRHRRDQRHRHSKQQLLM